MAIYKAYLVHSKQHLELWNKCILGFGKNAYQHVPSQGVEWYQHWESTHKLLQEWKNHTVIQGICILRLSKNVHQHIPGQ